MISPTPFRFPGTTPPRKCPIWAGLGQVEFLLCVAETTKLAFAVSSHGKQKRFCCLGFRERPRFSPCLSASRASTSDEAETTCRSEMTNSRAFGLSAKLPVSLNEEIETQRGSSQLWGGGVGAWRWKYQQRLGRGAVCWALLQVTPFSPIPQVKKPRPTWVWRY